ncbi:unnamed protein product, partial [marine sediment metagenome]
DGTLRVINEYIDLIPIRLIKVKRMTLSFIELDNLPIIK